MAISDSDQGESPPSDEPSASGRNPDGTFAKGNVAALRHGLRSQQVRSGALPEQASERARLMEKRAAILTDLGGDTEVSQLQQDLIDRYLELDLVASWLGGNLIAQGPLTAKGRTRAALSAYVIVVDRVHRVASGLGLARRSKPVSLDDYLGRTYRREIDHDTPVTPRADRSPESS